MQRMDIDVLGLLEPAAEGRERSSLGPYRPRRLQRGGGGSSGAPGRSGSWRQRAEDLEGRLQSAVQKFENEHARTTKLEKQLSTTRSQLTTAAQAASLVGRPSAQKCVAVPPKVS